jgi:DNA-binding winged helix-turn-helix (wHTH) protein/serine/threonine protein kinase
MESSNGNIRYTVYRFAQCEFETLNRRFWVDGTQKELHPKTQSVLLALLQSAPLKLTRGELLEKVWGTDEMEEQPLSNAIYHLRLAISMDPRKRNDVVRTLRGDGFRIVVPVEKRVIEESAVEGIRFAKDESVAGKRDWRLTEPLDRAPHQGSPHLWKAHRPTTSETHVFKFAVDDWGRELLSAEVDKFRELQDTIGFHPGFVRLHDWRLTTKPYFLEIDDGGETLQKWAEMQRAHAGLKREICLELMADLASAVAVLHSCKILHNDLRPSTVFVSPPPASGNRWQVRLGSLKRATSFVPQGYPAGDQRSSRSDTAELQHVDAVRVDQSGITSRQNKKTSTAGAPDIYQAPEVTARGLRTPASDVYALGILLYQLLCGDFSGPLTSEWQELIDDRTLSKDITEATYSDPTRRLEATFLAERLRSVEDRRTNDQEHHLQLQTAQRRVEAAERRLTVRNARRPWITAAAILLMLGIAISLWFYHQASRDREMLRSQNATLLAMNDFLSVDLLSQLNPLVAANNTKETLLDALERTLPQINRRFHDAPGVAGGLHLILGGAFDARTQFSSAEQEFTEAEEDFQRAEGPLSENALIAAFRRDNALLRSQSPSAVAEAKLNLEAEKSMMKQLASPSPLLQMWEAMAESGADMMSGHPADAIPVLSAAVKSAEKSLHFDPVLLIALKMRFVGVYLGLNDGADAERFARAAIVSLTALYGPDSPQLFQADMYLEEALYTEGLSEQVKQQSSRDYDRFKTALGLENQLTLSALYMRGEAEGSLGEYEPAIQDLMTVNAAEHSLPNSAFWLVNSLVSAAMLECHAGYVSSGLVHARESLEESISPSAPLTQFANQARFAIAECLVIKMETQGHPDSSVATEEAQRLLASVDIPSVTSTTGLADFEASFDLTRARLMLRLGDLAAAQLAVAKATPALTKQSADPYEAHILKVTVSKLDKALELASIRDHAGVRWK